MNSDRFQRDVLDEGLLNRHWIVKENGRGESAARIRDLPETLRLYAKLLECQLCVELRLAQGQGKLRSRSVNVTV